MIPVTTFKDQHVALFGLGGSGMVTAEALLAGGAQLQAYDDNPEKVGEAAATGIPVGDLREYDFENCQALVLAPGVPLTHPKPHWSVELAQKNNVPIIGDVELFARERRAHAPQSNFIAITGTNGKSTTTALVSHILSNAERNVEMGGNIGRAVLSLDPPNNDTIHVVECSSYQIDLAPSLDPKIGLLLNLTPDHLERHGSMENYAGIKVRLVAGSQHPVIGVDDVLTSLAADDLQSSGKQVYRISASTSVEDGAFACGDTMSRCSDGTSKQVATLKGIASLRGSHNRENAAAAWMACHLSGLSNAEIQNGFSTFPGLAHRMEVVGSIGSTSFINDSKATNTDAAGMALESFERIYWIAGGLAKDGGIEDLRKFFPHIAKAYLVGEAAPEFAATLGSDVAYEISGTIETAVARAAREATADDTGEAVVLLSPACASFDQFANFEVRGDAFRKAVTQLDNLVPYGEAI